MVYIPILFRFQFFYCPKKIEIKTEWYLKSKYGPINYNDSSFESI